MTLTCRIVEASKALFTCRVMNPTVRIWGFAFTRTLSVMCVCFKQKVTLKKSGVCGEGLGGN